MESPARPRSGLPAVLLAIAVCALALDQLTKALVVARIEEGRSVAVIKGVFHLTLQRNPGAAFSLFQHLPVAFTILATAIAAAILLNLRRVPDRFNAIALGLVLGGALGNLADRLLRAPGPLRGHVVDFLDFRVWPVFNVADSCVVVGALLLVLGTWRRDRDRDRAHAKANLEASGDEHADPADR